MDSHITDTNGEDRRQKSRGQTLKKANRPKEQWKIYSCWISCEVVIFEDKPMRLKSLSLTINRKPA